MPEAAVNRNRAVRVVTTTRPLLRVSRPYEGRYIWLRKGREGSLQTALEMAKLVRHDSVSDEGLERFAVQKLISAGLDSHSRPEDVIEILFKFVQAIPYIFDPAGSFDSVQNARHTLAKGYGDCDDLAVLLATLLALVGYRPRFVLAKYKESTQGFDHVYVDVILSDNDPHRPGATHRIALDPCSRSHAAGWENRNAIERLTFPIFAGRVSSPLGAIGPLAMQGAAIGVNFIPVVGPFLSSLLGPIAGMFSRTQQRAEETQRDQWKDQVYDGMVTIQQAVDNCRLPPDQGVAAARELVANYYAACDSGFTKSSVAKSCRNFQDINPGGFTWREQQIKDSGKACGMNAGAAGSNGALNSGVAGSIASSMTGATGISLTTLLLIAAGVFVFMKMKG